MSLGDVDGTSADWVRGYKWGLAGGDPPAGKTSPGRRRAFLRGYEAGLGTREETCIDPKEKARVSSVRLFLSCKSAGLRPSKSPSAAPSKDLRATSIARSRAPIASSNASAAADSQRSTVGSEP